MKLYCFFNLSSKFKYLFYIIKTIQKTKQTRHYKKKKTNVR
jgi:hypothetical protein